MTRQHKRTGSGPASWSIGQDALEVGTQRGDVATVFSLTSAEVNSSINNVVVGIDVEEPHFNTGEVGVVSTPMTTFHVTTVGCMFSAASEKAVLPAFVAKPNGTAPGRNAAADVAAGETSLIPTAGSRTRLKPPRDLIKLEDRLRWLLQPPLEQLLAANSLSFAFTPFHFQLDGIAFLYPRQRAVLADEMGLGKTMQAITAVRLLVHQGQVRRALLVCPKPLVTNWQREFAQWAPEIPVGVIEGGPARRQWLWRSAADVVTIANYETVIRDRDDVCRAENEYDLVVLDESQRIKNASSTTNEVARSIPRARSWALTGTPIENSVEDLRGIFEFVAPDSSSQR